MAQTQQLDLETLILAKGAHPDRSNGLCVMEVVAFLAKEKHSDHPTCACPVLGSFLRSWNDSLDDATRQRLKPYIPRLIGTNDGHSDERAWMLIDWLIREYTPAWLDLAKLSTEAEALRSAVPITGPQTLATVAGAIAGAKSSAAAAWDAAWDAARAAAWAAARDAAWAAAWAAAGAAWDAAGAARDAAWAARDAAWDAARAARDAAWDAARAALKPTVETLQESAFALLDRMLSLNVNGKGR